ncbi:GntR family transcriptional regulator [Tardiphaga sp. vice352]|uniref:GntR family transcriptional regulator n=1 Tax=unclassified Tardiphaga TaxID=2631404 RepID=UPI0011644B86|nr:MULTISPECIES: GntR family transcriptional regulator [unclassified Tardiphaga]MBC7585767.1 GntR family transcriptional regulator [Tardiphaga sp.]QDM15562.1 GntR family transcriptional regulator [Tardiphaga sp. vice278]QDM20624.1 GntR family transcriptional regulator [Tardiphaga sp. vice154]QDM25758.1 GntR family transcriptional regulator [Tardiphaga sp. vice304]QDM30961.1 GntR family transcriptional regulator [Tardiphaga sp. vice352]
MRLITPPVGLTALADTDLVGQVARILTQAIIQGQLQPGTKVVEAGVARELGISRAPVREAARLLEQQGLLVSHPRRGFFVRKLKARDIDEIYDLRICVESHAAVLAARNMTPAARDALRRQIDVMYESADLDEPARQVEEDYKFHRMICEIADSARLLRLFDDLASELRMVIGLIGRLYDDPRRIAQTHEAVLDALVQGHPDIINARIDYHIGAAWHEVARLVRDIPQSSNGASS